MLNADKKRLLRRVLSVIAATLASLLVAPALCLSVVAFGFSSTASLADALVTDAYVLRAYESAREGLVDEALLYGVEQDVLLRALDEEKDALRENAVASVRSLLDSFFGVGEYAPAPFDPSVFERFVRDYLSEILTEQEGVEVDENSVHELAETSAKIVSGACSPLGGGLIASVAQKLSGVLPKALFDLLLPAALSLLGLTALLYLASVLLAAPKSRLFTLFSALFCASVLVFVPAFFLFSSVSLSDLALSEGVLLELVRALVSRFVLPLRISSAVLFGVCTLGLLTVIFLPAFAQKSSQEPVAAGAEDAPAEEQEQEEGTAE